MLNYCTHKANADRTTVMTPHCTFLGIIALTKLINITHIRTYRNYVCLCTVKYTMHNI